jgi:anti-sigma B factor antagonist
MIECRLVGSVTVLHIHGKLTLESGLRGAVHDAFESGSRRIVLNLKDVSGIDSSGFAELITCETTVLRRGGRLLVCSPSPRAYEVFAVTQLNSVFKVYDTEAQALASVQAT